MHGRPRPRPWPAWGLSSRVITSVPRRAAPAPAPGGMRSVAVRGYLCLIPALFPSSPLTPAPSSPHAHALLLPTVTEHQHQARCTLPAREVGKSTHTLGCSKALWKAIIGGSRRCVHTMCALCLGGGGTGSRRELLLVGQTVGRSQVRCTKEANCTAAKEGGEEGTTRRPAALPRLGTGVQQPRKPACKALVKGMGENERWAEGNRSLPQRESFPPKAPEPAEP